MIVWFCAPRYMIWNTCGVVISTKKIAQMAKFGCYEMFEGATKSTCVVWFVFWCSWCVLVYVLFVILWHSNFCCLTLVIWVRLIVLVVRAEVFVKHRLCVVFDFLCCGIVCQQWMSWCNDCGRKTIKFVSDVWLELDVVMMNSQSSYGFARAFWMWNYYLHLTWCKEEDLQLVYRPLLIHENWLYIQEETFVERNMWQLAVWSITFIVKDIKWHLIVCHLTDHNMWIVHGLVKLKVQILENYNQNNVKADEYVNRKTDRYDANIHQYQSWKK